MHSYFLNHICYAFLLGRIIRAATAAAACLSTTDGNHRKIMPMALNIKIDLAITTAPHKLYILSVVVASTCFELILPFDLLQCNFAKHSLSTPRTEI